MSNEILNDDNVTEKVHFVKITYDVLFNENLSDVAKFLLPVIKNLDTTEKGCWASNGYLAAYINSSERTVSRAISELISEGFLDKEWFDGRTRTLRVKNEDFDRIKIAIALKDKRLRKFKRDRDKEKQKKIEEEKNKDRDGEQDSPNMAIKGCQDWRGGNAADGVLLISDTNNKIQRKNKTTTKVVDVPCGHSVNNEDDFLDSEERCPEEEKPLETKNSEFRNKFKNKKQKEPDSIDSDAEALLLYWKGHKLKTSERESTDKKVFKKILSGNFFTDGVCQELGIDCEDQSFSVDEIRLSIQNFSKNLQGNKNKSLKQIVPETFFYSRFNKKTPSSFLFNLKNKAVPKVELPPDPDSELTEEIKSYYIKSICNGNQFEPFSDKDEKYFRQSSKFVLEYIQKFENSFQVDAPSKVKMGKLLVNAAIEFWDGNKHKVNPSTLCCKKMTSEFYSKFLTKENVILDEKARNFRDKTFTKKRSSQSHIPDKPIKNEYGVTPDEDIEYDMMDEYGMFAD